VGGMDRLRLIGMCFIRLILFAFGSLAWYYSPSALWPGIIRLRLFGLILFAFGSLV